MGAARRAVQNTLSTAKTEELTNSVLKMYKNTIGGNMKKIAVKVTKNTAGSNSGT